MRLLRRLEAALGRFAVPHVTLGLILCQVVVAVAALALDRRPEVRELPEERVHAKLDLVPAKVLEGQVWRVFTFLLLPPSASVLLSLCFWYAFWLFGTALEGYWGTFRYNLYLLAGWAATVAASFVAPDAPASNAFLELGVFLAFAWLNPEFPIALFFVLVVPIKWVARVTWAGLLLSLVIPDWTVRLVVLASIANFLLFFAREIWDHARTGHRRMARRAAAFAEEAPPPSYTHRCRVCGITDRSHPRAEFRYCSRCAGNRCYCMEHIRAHEHVA